MQLWPFQEQKVEEFERKVAEGIRRIILVAPTGSGKTIIASEIIKRGVAEYKRVVFIAHRSELLTQARDKLRSFGVTAGIIKAGRDKDARPQSMVQICRHPDVACPHSARKDYGAAAGRNHVCRRITSRQGVNVSDHRRRLSRRHHRRIDGNTLPRRWPRARQRIRGDDRMSADRRTDRARASGQAENLRTAAAESARRRSRIDRRLRHQSIVRSHGHRRTGRRFCSALAQACAAAAHDRVRRRCRTLAFTSPTS